MARKVWKLNKFDKGINSYTDPKDISDSEWATLEDVNVSKVGIAKTLGIPTKDSSVHNTKVGDLISGKGLYRFSSDNAFMSNLDDDSWHALSNTQNAGSDVVLSQATFGIKSLVWLFDAKPTNVRIQFTLKVNGTAIMSAMDVLNGNLGSTPYPEVTTTTNVFKLSTMVAGGFLIHLWEQMGISGVDFGARNTNIPFTPVIYWGDDTSRYANGDTPAYSTTQYTEGAWKFWDFPPLENGWEPLGNLNDPDLIFKAAYDSGNPPLQTGSLDFHNYYMLGFYSWDGYESGLEFYENIFWPILDSEFHVPQSKYAVETGEMHQNYQKARLSFMSELIKEINSYTGGSAANQFSAKFVHSDDDSIPNWTGAVHQTNDPNDMIYMEPRTGTAAGNAGGDITADITCASATGANLYGSGINLLDDTDRYGQGGYEGGGGAPDEEVISDEEVIDADGGSMVLQLDTAVNTGNAGTIAEVWELVIYGNPQSQKLITINIIGHDSMGNLTVQDIADYATNEAFANAIGSEIGAASDYSCSSATDVTGYAYAFSPYKITITGGTTSLAGGFNMTVIWSTSEGYQDEVTGVSDEQLALVSKTGTTINTLNSITIKKTDFRLWTEQGTSWIDSFSNSNLNFLAGAKATRYLNWFYTPTQNNDPVFYDEGSMLRISESNFELLDDLNKLFTDNNILEDINGTPSPMESNPGQWLGYKNLSNHFKDRDGNQYFIYNSISKGFFIGKLAKIWRYTKDSSDTFARAGVSVDLNTDLDVDGNAFSAEHPQLQFYMVRDTNGGGIDWNGNIKVYAVACYDDGSESLPGHYFSTFLGTSTDNYFGNIEDGYSLKIELLFRPQAYDGLKCFDDARINGVRLYYTHSEENHSTFWNLGKLDFNRGFIKAVAVDTVDNTLGNEARYEWRNASLAPEDGVTEYNADAIDTLTVYDDVSNSFTIEYKEMPKTQAYEDINGHSVSVSTLNVGYKAVCIAGRRAFVGNIRVWNGASYEYYNDRMVVSPVNSLDTFPYPDNVLDLDISDGDKIIALAAFGDKVIQFKQRIAYIMNIATGIASEFFVEERHKWKGILDKNHFCVTDKGIFWFNERGAWIYDGDELRDLFILEDEDKSQQKIDIDEWQSFVSIDSLVGYNALSREIIIVKNHTHASSEDADCYVFSLIVESWTKGKKRFFSAANKSMTNFQNIGDLGKMAYFIEEDPGGTADRGEIR